MKEEPGEGGLGSAHTDIPVNGFQETHQNLRMLEIRGGHRKNKISVQNKYKCP